jgi:tRNA U34 5-methylaminomethyl-2-thiouridine-forming methyltransferase MnmC
MALFITDDGSHSVYSEKFGVAYHSTHGAIQETRHIFIEAGLKHFITQHQAHKIAILEMGFGTGLNVFMTYLESLNQNTGIDFHTIEAYPLSISTTNELNYPQLLNVPQHDAVFKKLHSLDWAEKHSLTPHFSFQKHLIDFKDISFSNTFDVIYYDAFSPDSQPELWDVDMLKRVYEAMKIGGILTTYCAKGSFRRALKSVGFQIENIAGPAGKREITRASKGFE